MCYSICIGTIGSGLWRSPDGGDSWARVQKGLWSESRVFGLTVHPTEPQTIFAGADDGIYKSSDGGQSFARLESPMNKMRRVEDRDRPVEPGHHLRRDAAGGALPLEGWRWRAGTSSRSIWPMSAPMSASRG